MLQHFIKPLYLIGFFLVSLLTGCGSSSTSDTTTQADAADAPRPKTPVEVTTVKADSFRVEKTFRGMTYYLTSGDIKSPIAGYVTKVYVKIGDQLRKGSPLFGYRRRNPMRWVAKITSMTLRLKTSVS